MRGFRSIWQSDGTALHARLIAPLLFALGTSCAPRPQIMHLVDGRHYLPMAPPKAEQFDWKLPASASTQQRIDALHAQMQQRLKNSQASGASLVLVLDGEVALISALGRIRPDGAAVDGDTLFILASVSKIFTGLAGLIAAERGVWNMDAPLATFLDRVDPRITPRLALSHRAGVADSNGCEKGLASPSDWAAAHGGDPLWSPPGALWNYSNAGFTLAAAALEHATGRAFREIVQEWVLRPLGASAATYAPAAENVAQGQNAKLGQAPKMDCGLMNAAGGVWMSANDVAAVLRALVGARPSSLSSQVLTAQMTPLASIGNGDTTRYGHGVFLQTHGHDEVAYHLGGLPWFGAGMLWIPSRRFGIAYMSNGPDVAPIIQDAVHLFFPDMPIPERQPLNRGWQDYAGIWEDPSGQLGVFRIEPERETIRLVPLGRQKVWPIPVDATFWFDDTGHPEYFATRLGVARKRR